MAKLALLCIFSAALAAAFVPAAPTPVSFGPRTCTAATIVLGLKEQQALDAKAKASRAAAAAKQAQAAKRAQAKAKADAAYRKSAAAKAAAAARRPKQDGEGLPFMHILRRQAMLNNQKTKQNERSGKYIGGFKFKF